jgi:hypothetical protein
MQGQNVVKTADPRRWYTVRDKSTSGRAFFAPDKRLSFDLETNLRQ